MGRRTRAAVARPHPLAPLPAVVAGLVLALIGMLLTPVRAAADPPAAPGASMATAAASCWEVKQRVPEANDGIYWLVTPRLQRPMQFYCDMTTDGGGWVLIGRGREGWRSEYEGQGSAAEVRDVITGPEAFRTRQLPSTTIDALLDGARVDALPDGVRLRRATSPDGSSWQEVRFQLRQRDRWVWTFRARQPIKAFSFDGTSSPSVLNTYDFGFDTAARRVNTDLTAEQRWNAGWAFGPGVSGVSADASYVWSATEGAGKALPFTQVFLRPRLLSGDLTYPLAPDTGLPPVAQRPLAQTRAMPTVWGVAGLASGPDSEVRSEVQAFAQIGSTVYVGGNFRTVQRSETGADQVAQSHLAAFDVDTGQFLPGFRPTFNDQVKALAALPNGRLAVGGEFTTSNGAPATGFAVLDATTGQSVNELPITLQNNVSGNPPAQVRSLHVDHTVVDGVVTRSWLYIGGVFTHLARAGSPTTVRSQSAARVGASDGRLDPTWGPIVNGSVNDITPSTDGTRVYLAGFFTAINGATTYNVGALTGAGPATRIAWQPRYSIDETLGKAYQWVVAESANRVWHGGSQHNFFSYDKSSLAYSYGGIALQGGDFQTAVVDGDVVYGGCHCIDYLYSGVTKYAWPSTFDQGDKIGFVGAWDESTGRYLPDFDPILTARGGYGAWASMVDSNGVLWVGGSFTRAINVRGTNQWVGGFVRFAPRDATPPQAPSGLQADGRPGEVSLTWSGIAEAGVDYEVLENGRVVAATASTSTVLPLPTGPVQYAVRAVDAADNRSASTAPVVFDPVGLPVTTTVVGWGATWAWRYEPTAPDPLWTGQYDDSAWSRGPAPLGFGAASLATVIHTGATSTRPLSAQFWSTFQVPDPGAVGGIVIEALANDGVVLYLNGREIGRRNLPEGPVTASTYATAAPLQSAAVTSPLQVTVPADALVAGENVLAAQIHLNYRGTRDAGFDARIRLIQAPAP